MLSDNHLLISLVLDCCLLFSTRWWPKPRFTMALSKLQGLAHPEWGLGVSWRGFPSCVGKLSRSFCPKGPWSIPPTVRCYWITSLIWHLFCLRWRAAPEFHVLGLLAPSPLSPAALRDPSPYRHLWWVFVKVFLETLSETKLKMFHYYKIPQSFQMPCLL